MFQLAPANDGWVTLLPHAEPIPVEAQFRPISRAAVRAASRAAMQVLQSGGTEEDAGDAFTAELVRRGLAAWKGIGDAKGRVLAVTPETIEGFIANAILFDAADRLYVQPFTALSAEKNVSSPSRPGTSGARTGAKPIARRAATAAKTAPTASTRRKPTKAKTPGA